MTRNRGFTLLEMTIVLVIIGLLMALVPPALSGALESAQNKDAARRVAAALRTARANAVATYRDATVTLDVENKRFTVSGRSKVYELPEQLTMKVDTVQSEVIDEGIASIRFHPDGTSTGGRVTLSQGEEVSFMIDIDWLTGRVRIANDHARAR